MNKKKSCLNLYWLTTKSYPEDWFIVAKSKNLACECHEYNEGFNLGCAHAELICEIPMDLEKKYRSEHDDINYGYWPSLELLKELDFEFIEQEPPYIVRRNGKLLYIVSSLISEIQNNTLILFDEPETHLHPNAISILMNFLYNLLDEFNSFCIIATHSPLVVQEVSSRNIKVFKRIGNLLEIQGVGYETFAENLTTITNEIFDNREVAQYHINIMKDIVDSQSKGTYDSIISIFQNGNIPTPLNVKLYIKELLNKNEKSKTI